MGDVDLGTLSLDELDLELAMGSVSADSLTVKDADFDLAMGSCHIDHLSAPEFDAELAWGTAPSVCCPVLRMSASRSPLARPL